MHNIRATIFMYWLVLASIGALIIRAIFEISKHVGVNSAGDSESVPDKLSEASSLSSDGMRRIVDGFCNFNEMFQNFTALLPTFPKINIDGSGSYDDNPKTTSYLRAKKDL